MNHGMDESYMHHRNTNNNNNNNNDNNSSGASSDFFSPISLGFFGNKDVLPRSHDTSWIGARQSPIPSFDREDEDDDDDVDDEEANRATEKYHKALHESLEAAAFVNERTSLLHHRRTALQQTRQGAAPIHPLWDGATPEERRIREINSHCRILWGDVFVVLTGVHLGLCSAWEVYLWRSDDDGSPTLTWMSILQPRSAQTLLLMGALDAETVLVNEEYWRLLSSLVVCPSLLNWVLVCLGWTLLYSARRQDTLLSWYSWFGTWFASALVGLVWMMAWDLRIRPVVGCALWGTGGVLTAAGMHRPEARWCHFLACILAVVLSWWEQPYNSVYGIVGATFFGWGLGAATRQSLATKGPSGLSYGSIGVVLSIVLAPVLSIAFWGTDVPFLS